MINYLFGFNGEPNLALNHIILELKKMIFYNLLDFNNPEAFCENVFGKIRNLIMREKTPTLTKHPPNFANTHLDKTPNFKEFQASRSPMGDPPQLDSWSHGRLELPSPLEEPSSNHQMTHILKNSIHGM